MKELDVYIGRRIKEHREKMKFTQEDIAKVLDVAPNHYGRIERGENSCTMDNFVKICNTIHTTPNEIMGGLIITAEEKVKYQIDSLNIDDRETASKFIEFLLSKYTSKN